MEVARQKKKADEEEAQKAVKAKALAAAMLEHAIEARDRQAAVGTADIIKKPRIASKAKTTKSTEKTVRMAVEEVSIASILTNNGLISPKLRQ